MSQILNCKAYLEETKKQALIEIKKHFEDLKIKHIVVIFNPNNDFANKLYVKNQIKHFEDCNIPAYVGKNVDINFIKNVFEKEKEENIKLKIHIIIQKYTNLENEIKQLENLICLNKKDTSLYEIIDLEYLCQFSKNEPSKLSMSYGAFTPYGIINILENLYINSKENKESIFLGKNVVIINRSNIIGKPLAELLLFKDATVTICHSKTPKEELIKYCKNADYIFVGVGKAKFLNAEFLNEEKKQYIIDFGTNFDENNKMIGDIDEESIKNKNVIYTKTPGGTGLGTIAQILNNILK